jgi:hypothetical protein
MYQQDALLGGPLNLDVVIELTTLSNPVTPNAKVTITLDEVYVWRMKNHEFVVSQPVPPREDVSFKVYATGVWEFDDGQGAVVTASMDGNSGAAWGDAPPFSAALQYKVWDELGIGTIVPGYEPAWTGDFDMEYVDASDSYRRTLTLTKPLSQNTVSMLLPGSRASFGWPSNLISISGDPPLIVDFMGLDSIGALTEPLSYEFDEYAIVDWRIESAGGRVQEVVVFENSSSAGPPGFASTSGTVRADQLSISW